MHKTFIVILGLLIAACGVLNRPVLTTTTIPSPTSLPATIVPTVPTLVREIKLETQTDTSYTLDWSPDGKTLAVASGYEITLLSNDLTETHAVLKPAGGGLAITWSPDQRRFATVNGFRNPTVKIWDWDSANLQLTLAQEIKAGSDQYGVFWSPDGKRLATLADDDKSTFQLWDATTWEEMRKFDVPYAKPRRTISWSADSSKLYAAGEARGQVFVFALRVADGTVQELAKFPVAEVEGFAFSPDTTKLAVADARGAVRLLDLAAGETYAEFQSVDQPVDLAWSPDGKTLAILAYKTKLQLWNIASMR